MPVPRRVRPFEEAIARREEVKPKEEPKPIPKPKPVEVKKPPAPPIIVARRRVRKVVPIKEEVKEVKKELEKIEKKVAEKIPTLKEIEAAGREFARARPEVAKPIVAEAERVARVTRRVVPEKVGVPVAEFAVGAAEELQRRPLKAAAMVGVTLAAPGVIRVAKEVPRITGITRAAAPAIARIRAIPGIERVPKAAEIGVTGLYGISVAERVRAPIDERPPTPAEMARRAGRTFITEVAPIAVGVGVAPIVGRPIRAVERELELRRLREIPTPVVTRRVTFVGEVGPRARVRPIRPAELVPEKVIVSPRIAPDAPLRPVITRVRAPPERLTGPIVSPELQPLPTIPREVTTIRVTDPITGITRVLEVPKITPVKPIRRVARVRPITPTPEPTRPTIREFLKAEEAELLLQRPRARPIYGEAAFRTQIGRIPREIMVPPTVGVRPTQVGVISGLLAARVVPDVRVVPKVVPTIAQMPARIQTVVPIQELVPIREPVLKPTQIPRIKPVPVVEVAPVTVPKRAIRPAVAEPFIPIIPLVKLPKKVKKKVVKVDKRRKVRKFEKVFVSPIASPFGSVGRIK